MSAGCGFLEEAFVRLTSRIFELLYFSAITFTLFALLGCGNGGSQEDNSAEHAGAVYLFRNAPNIWSQQAYVKASNTAIHEPDGFGTTVALSADGKTLAVGAPWEDSANGNLNDNSIGDPSAVYLY